MNVSLSSAETQISSVNNPFVVESPERLTPEKIVSLFIEKYTRIGIVRQKKHTFVWGSRGSGKSMMLRYLEPRCQAIVHGGQVDYSREDSFLAIYCPCKEGQINKTELRVLNTNALQTLTEHMINLVVADRLVHCLRTQFPPGFLETQESDNFSSDVVDLFDPASIASSLRFASSRVDGTKEPLRFLQEIFGSETRRISSYLRSTSLLKKAPSYDGATSGYHDFLLPMLRALRRYHKLSSVPIFILLDDADRLTRDQQTIINSWIANRDQETVCLKVSSQREEYRTFTTKDGGMLEQPHDYSEIDVDELYTKNSSAYAEKIQLIADRRLQLSSIPVTIEEFLPENPTQEQLLKRIKKETADEWQRVNEPGDQGDYVTRYAMARLFQLLKEKKMKKSYAGFQNLVHISSGIVRDFLEPCFLMFEESNGIGKDPSKTHFIEPGIQDRVIHRYSEDFLIPKFREMQKDLPPEKWETVERLRTLVESMGRLLYEKLHDPDSREPRLFSFTIRGPVPRELEEVLRLGVRYRYFQTGTYSSKEGGGREQWYILNRRLCPIYKLDPTGFEGRVSLTTKLLEVACKDPVQFVRLRLREGVSEKSQSTLPSFEELDD